MEVGKSSGTGELEELVTLSGCWGMLAKRMGNEVCLCIEVRGKEVWAEEGSEGVSWVSGLGPSSLHQEKEQSRKVRFRREVAFR